MYRWIELGDGRSVYRKVRDDMPARSGLASPMIMNDKFDRPVQCMADGKFYESKRAMSAAHKAHGFVELGDHRGPICEKPAYDEKSARADIKRALDKAGVDPHRIVEP